MKSAALIRSISYPLMAVLVALILGAVFLVAIGKNPLQAYGALFAGAAIGTQSIAGSLVVATPLLLTSLGVGLSFRSGFFNIGAGGQLAMGALAAAIVGGYSHLPGVIVMLLMVLAGAAVGAAWGAIAGVLRALTGASEIITTLMLNYVALYVIDYAVTGPFKAPGTINQTPPLPTSAQFPLLIGNTQLTWAFPFALLMVVVVSVVLNRTPFGFELRMSGHNAEAAEASGISVRRVAVLALAVSGLLAGLGGAIEVGGILYAVPQGFSIQTGYDAITVALLGGNSPIGILLASLFLGGLNNGATLMEALVGVSGPFVQFLEAIVIVALVGAPLIIRRRRERRMEVLG